MSQLMVAEVVDCVVTKWLAVQILRCVIIKLELLLNGLQCLA